MKIQVFIVEIEILEKSNLDNLTGLTDWLYLRKIYFPQFRGGGYKLQTGPEAIQYRVKH